MKIEVLGPGCMKCKKLHENVEAAMRDLGLACQVEKVTDMQKIISYDVMTTPALVVDGTVKVAGRVPSSDEIKQILS